MVKITAIDFRDFIAGEVDRSWLTGDFYRTGAGYMPVNGTGKNCVTVFRFTTTEPVKNPTLSLCLVQAQTLAGSEIRYKLVSGAEDSSLINATSDTAGDGACTIPSTVLDSTRVEFPVNRTIPAGTHYFYLWTNKPSGTYNYATFQYSIDTTYDQHCYVTCEEGSSGAVPIYNGSSFDPYDAGVYNGSGWDLHDPYIYDGNDWVPHDGG